MSLALFCFAIFALQSVTLTHVREDFFSRREHRERRETTGRKRDTFRVYFISANSTPLRATVSFRAGFGRGLPRCTLAVQFVKINHCQENLAGEPRKHSGEEWGKVFCRIIPLPMIPLTLFRFVFFHPHHLFGCGWPRCALRALREKSP